MKSHGEKIFEAAVSAALIITLLLFYPAVLSLIEKLPFGLTFIFSAVYILLAAGVLYQLIMRIREIRGGEEDDLDNY